METPQTLNPELKAYIEAEILPRYRTFDRAHNLDHVHAVIDRSLELAAGRDVDLQMVYTIAAYHDTGLVNGRERHHLDAGRILAEDPALRRWFTEEQIRTMREAVEDHRASSQHAPRSIYGRLVAEADRQIDPATILRRTVQYSLAHYPAYDREEHFARCVDHLWEKYAERGLSAALDRRVGECPKAGGTAGRHPRSAAAAHGLRHSLRGRTPHQSTENRTRPGIRTCCRNEEAIPSRKLDFFVHDLQKMTIFITVIV